MVTTWGVVLIDKLTVVQLLKKSQVYLWNTEVHYHIKRNRLLDHIFSHKSSLYPISLRTILIFNLPLRLRSTEWSLSCFSTNISYVFLISLIRSMCPTYLILLELTTVTSGGKFGTWTSCGNKWSYNDVTSAASSRSTTNVNVLRQARTKFARTWNLCIEWLNGATKKCGQLPISETKPLSN